MNISETVESTLKIGICIELPVQETPIECNYLKVLPHGAAGARGRPRDVLAPRQSLGRLLVAQRNGKKRSSSVKCKCHFL